MEEENNDLESPQDKANNTEPDSALESMGKFIWDLAKIIILSLIIVIPIRYFLFQPFVVSGMSMEPNLNDGDYLIIDEITYRFKNPQRGDIVVLRFPDDPSQFFIKRIIGLPGETVTIKNNQVRIAPENSSNSFVLNENYLGNNTVTTGNYMMELDKDHYLVLGDNRDASSDSRTWGSLAEENIVGRVLLRVLPVYQLQVFNSYEYQSINK